MTRTCVLCKKQPVPFKNTRSFHKFPVNFNLREKWMQLTGISVISLNSVVCSHHFAAHSFHPNNAYITVKKLLPNAVPSIGLHKKILYMANEGVASNSENEMPFAIDNILRNSLIQVNETCKSNECMENYINTANINGNVSSEVNCNDLTETPNTSVTLKPVLEDNEISNYGQISRSLKRKRLTDNSENLNKKKRFHFMHGSQSSYISRADFILDTAWDKFVKYTSYKNAQVLAVRQKKWRRENKIKNMKDVIYNLRANKASAAADYLQSAYKKLLLNNMNVTVPLSANISPQDETLLISDVTRSDTTIADTTVHGKVKNTSNKISSFEIGTFLHQSYDLLEHDYSKKNAWVNSEYLDDIIKDTAGAVVHSIKKKNSLREMFRNVVGFM